MALDWLRWRAWAGVDVVVAAAVGVAGLALGDIHLRFTWYLVTSTSTLRGRRGPYGTGLAPVARLGRSGRGVAWQAWHLETSTFVSCGGGGGRGSSSSNSCGSGSGGGSGSGTAMVVVVAVAVAVAVAIAVAVAVAVPVAVPVAVAAAAAVAAAVAVVVVVYSRCI